MDKQNEIFLNIEEQRLQNGLGEAIDLPRKPTAMLSYFTSNQNVLLTVDQILRNVWPETVVSKHSVKDYVADIRKALCDDANNPRYIETIRGVGYRYLGGISVVNTTSRQRVLGLGKDTTSFVGRKCELEDLLATLKQSECRVLTIVGPGGIGKTRLAVAAARTLQNDGSIAFINLTQVESEELVIANIADTLGITVSNTRPSVDLIVDRLANKPTLLVIDNFDCDLHSSKLLELLVERLPFVKLLITSRNQTNIYGEWAFSVVGLSLRSENGLLNDAQKLFVQAAQRSDNSFVLDDKSARVVTDICRALAGIPLAIEIAATWIRTLGLDSLSDAIKINKSLLKNVQPIAGYGDLSLSVLMHQHWDSLSSEEKTTMGVLSLFRNSASEEALIAISGCNKETIARLIAKNMCTGTDDKRYELHEVMRDYAAEWLSSSSNSNKYKGMYINYYLEFVHTADERILTADQFRWLKLLGLEKHNLRQAIKWCEADSSYASHDQGLEIICNLSMCWFVSNAWREGIQWSSKMLQQAVDANQDKRAGAELTLAGLYALSEKFSEAEEMLLSCTLAFKSGPSKLKARTCIALGIVYRRLGRYSDSIDQCKASLSIYAENPDDGDALVALAGLGQSYLDSGDYELAVETFELSVDKCKLLGVTSTLPHALVNLARAYWAIGSIRKANENLEQCLVVAEAVGIKIYIAQSHVVSGWIEMQCSNIEKALTSFFQAAEIFQDLGHQAGLAECINGMAVCACETDYISEAAQLLAASDKLQEELGIVTRTDCSSFIGEATKKVKTKLSKSQLTNCSLFGRSLSTNLLISEFCKKSGYQVQVDALNIHH